MTVCNVGNLKQEKCKNLFVCITLSFIAASLSLGWIMLTNSGVFTLRADFNSQQIPFTMLSGKMISKGINTWCWNIDLGSSFIQGMSFYNLGSPFFWLSLIFPEDKFVYLVGFLYILKYVLASVTAYLYISLFVKDSKFAVFGAFLYAFSGFQTTNLLFYHFHDVVAFFPLLLFSLEKCMQDKRNRSLMIFAVFVNALLNYYFFVQEVIFLVIYFLIKFVNGSFKDILTKSLRCIYSGVIGVGMSAILFLPNILYILGNNRANSNITLAELLVSPQYFLFILKGILLPGEVMSDHSAVFSQEWSSTSAYLPLVGISLVLAYILTKKDWLSLIIKILLPISFIPLLSSGFLLFTDNTRRWWFMMVLMMALASSLVLENHKAFKTSKGIAITGISVLVFYFLVSAFPLYEHYTEPSVFHKLRFLGYTLIALSGLLITYFIFKSKSNFFKYAISFTLIFAVGTTSVTAYFYRETAPDTYDYTTSLELGAKLENIDDQYRYNNGDNLLMMTGNASGINSFSSTVSVSIAEFDNLFDYYQPVARLDKNSIKGLPQLLAAKYVITEEKPIGDYKEIISVGNKKYYILEDNVCPIGYRVDSYILEEQLKLLPVENRGVALLDSAVIKSDDEIEISKIIPNNNKIDLEKSLDEYVNENSANSVKNFKRSEKGFSCKTDYDEDSLIYFSVPFDKGWHAFVDGTETKIINSGGMMLLPVSGGQHNVEFFYSTPGYNLGVCISVFAFCLFAVILIYDTVKK